MAVLEVDGSIVLIVGWGMMRRDTTCLCPHGEV